MEIGKDVRVEDSDELVHDKSHVDILFGASVCLFFAVIVKITKISQQMQ